MLSDLLLASDQGQVFVLCLLDLIAAFDTVDHSLLLTHLQLQCFRVEVVYVLFVWQKLLRGRGRTDVSFRVIHTMCSVPQGSVLGPFLFILYMADLADIAVHSTTCHYVRLLMTIRLYNHCQPENAQSAVISVQRCVSATEQWMAASRLILNVDNTELMWKGIPFNLTKVPVCGFSVTLGSAYHHHQQQQLTFLEWPK